MRIVVHSLAFHRALIASILGWLIGCSGGTDIVALNGDALEQGLGIDTERKNEGDLEADEERGIDRDDEDEGDDKGSEESNIEYPRLDFQGRGYTTCDRDTFTSTASITTNLQEDKLEINMTQARVLVGDKGQDKADKEVNSKIGMIVYTRPSKEEIRKFKEDGWQNSNAVIFATMLNKTAQGQIYHLEKPLPVYPFPAPASRYDELKDGPKTWRSKVTGTHNFDVAVTVTRVSQSGDLVTLKISADIPSDYSWAIYEDFPIAYEATYVVNTVERDVRQISSVNRFLGDRCDGKRETVNMNYKLCTKTTSKGPEAIPCQ